MEPKQPPGNSRNTRSEPSSGEPLPRRETGFRATQRAPIRDRPRQGRGGLLGRFYGHPSHPHSRIRAGAGIQLAAGSPTAADRLRRGRDRSLRMRVDAYAGYYDVALTAKVTAGRGDGHGTTRSMPSDDVSPRKMSAYGAS